MIGAILGDIAGSSYEFKPNTNYNLNLFPADASFTDDTICTIAVADAIISGRPYKDSIHYWCRKYPNPKGGYGGSFLRWVISDDPKPYGSYGNGSAMRVSAIGWLFNTDEDVLAEAGKSAVVSHSHPEGIKGAQAIAYAVFLARTHRETSIKEIANLIADEFEYTIEPLESYRGHFEESCQRTLPAALCCLSESNNFEDAIRLAVSLGADADTLGAIVGSVAEAYYGIPFDLYRRAYSYLPEDMRFVISKFYKAYGRK